MEIRQQCVAPVIGWRPASSLKDFRPIFLRRRPAAAPRRLAFLLLAFGAVRLPAEVRCAKLFGDHMVLQREMPVPVWGEAAPREAVTVAFAGQALTAVADASGRWRVTLDPLAASAEPRTLTVRGTNILTYADVLVGEVWFCSGQSNMEKPFGPRKGQRPIDDQELEVAAAHYPLLRLYQVPRTDLPQDGPGRFAWLPCSPEALRASDFSAVAYYFGQQVHQVLGVPVGLIHSSFGGTYIDAWMPAAAFAAPALQGQEKRRYPAWVPGVQPTELYQSMVAPYAPYAVRGFLWYQGETNLMGGDVALYGSKQTALIAAWRKAWGRPGAPFYGVLLAPMEYSLWGKFPLSNAALPAFWEQQIRALSAPHTGYAVITDTVANLHDVHPTAKRPVGQRLARLALADTYGRTDIPAHGPTFVRLRATGRHLELTFDHAEGLRARDSRPLTGFTIAGSDQAFQPAQALIQVAAILVSSDTVAHPVAARFAWQETAQPNLVNEAGLPAAPFRTDDWPLDYLRPAPVNDGGPPAR